MCSNRKVGTSVLGEWQIRWAKHYILGAKIIAKYEISQTR